MPRHRIGKWDERDYPKYTKEAEMGKASDRRKKWRASHLEDLAQRDPKRFMLEWGKRLESWSREARRLAQVMRDQENRKVAGAYDVIAYAMGELERCGPAAVLMEAQSSKQALSNECNKAVAAAVSGSLAKLSIYDFCRVKEEYASAKEDLHA